MILAGDIGGTNTRLAAFALAAGRLVQRAEHVYPSPRYASLDDVVADFVTTTGVRPEVACFGLAGPVRGGRCVTTNLPWVVETDRLRTTLAITGVWLINDLEANAYGIAELGASDLVTLQAGEPGATGNAAIIAAGTGLGEAGLFWDGSRHLPFATEGGHADFAPADELEDELLRSLRQEFGRVSWERVVSGPGLAAIYRFLRDRTTGPELAWLAAEMASSDPAAVISHAALEERSALAVAALDLFVSLYGAEAGNLALKVMSTGGMYLGGGIAPKILPRLGAGGFLRAFTAKGRMRALLEAMPVHVITNDRTALLGAAHCAALRSGALPASC